MTQPHANPDHGTPEGGLPYEPPTIESVELSAEAAEALT